MSGSPVIGIVISNAFLGKAAYELAARKAYAKFQSIARDDNPWGYWIVVGTSLSVGSFVMYLSLKRLILV
jgi:hypothetical protein